MIEVLVPGRPFAETVAFFVDELGFRLQLITPADDPSLAVAAGPGVTVRIDRDAEVGATTLLLAGTGPTRHAPNGTVIERTGQRSLELPELVPELVVSREGDADAWVAGRAGMRYRDLVPSRLGGRFIASHIEVSDGGPVGDNVHHHDIRFQLIVCHRGWVDVVYQDQGPPFRMEAGDVVLQPPGIRHRVLAASAGARVVEIGCPAAHDTLFDHRLPLPNAERRPDRRYGGQRFVHHVAADSPWTPVAEGAVEAQVTDVCAATDGLAAVRILRPATGRAPSPSSPALQADAAAEFHQLFVLAGSVRLDADDLLEEGTAVTLPPARPISLSAPSDDLRLLEVTLPGTAS
ncbi:MAG: AraC family ligand binding domain-containing protein [Actinomycetota bacterium]